MEAIAYCMLGLVENLGKVTFQGPSFTKTVTVEDANAFFRWDIKTCGESVIGLDHLLQQTGLFYVSTADFTPDQMAIILWSTETRYQTYEEKDFSTIKAIYQRFQNIQFAGNYDQVEKSDYHRLQVAFYDSKTGQRIVYRMLGPYMEDSGDDGYFGEIVDGEDLYKELIAMMPEVDQE